MTSTCRLNSNGGSQIRSREDCVTVIRVATDLELSPMIPLGTALVPQTTTSLFTKQAVETLGLIQPGLLKEVFFLVVGRE